MKWKDDMVIELVEFIFIWSNNMEMQLFRLKILFTWYIYIYIYIKFHFIDIKEYKGGHDSRVEIVDKKTATKEDKNY